MTNDYTVEFEPLGRRIRVTGRETLLEAARQAGLGLNAVCGGAGVCGTCRVRVVDGEVTPPNQAERDFLDRMALDEGYRLACQTRVLSDVLVDVPPKSITAPQRAQIDGRERPVEIDPPVRGFDVRPAPPSLRDLRSDEKRLRRALRQRHHIASVQFDPLALAEVPPLLRESEWRVRLFVRDGEVIAAAPIGTSPLGLAVDIGTTKVAAYLVDLETGETLGSSGEMNPQIAYGEDVMARITYAMEEAGHARELQEVIVQGLMARASELCDRSGHRCEEILEVVMVGNTCMHHLALGLPVEQLGKAPYVPALSSSCDLKARDLELRIASGANVHFLPNIAGFVGADHVSMLMASGLYQAEEITLGLDIGTNTEVSLATEGRLLSCSTASGPAFEGAHIHHGMRAAPGAIEWVRMVDRKVAYQTIDGAPPAGICGSGILDSVAELRRIGVLRKNGSMRSDSHPRVRAADGRSEFVLVPAGERDAPRDVVITRKDVSEIQLAKGAIRAGIEVLLDEASLKPEQIERVVVAGAFGTYLDIDSALAVGMFPRLPRERFEQVGNAAGIGAKLALLSRYCREVAEEIADSVEYIELTTHPLFSEVYMASMDLP